MIRFIIWKKPCWLWCGEWKEVSLLVFMVEYAMVLSLSSPLPTWALSPSQGTPDCLVLAWPLLRSGLSLFLAVD
jgi:hypothetical protein